MTVNNVIVRFEDRTELHLVSTDNDILLLFHTLEDVYWLSRDIFFKKATIIDISEFRFKYTGTPVNNKVIKEIIVYNTDNIDGYMFLYPKEDYYLRPVQNTDKYKITKNKDIEEFTI